MPPCDSIVFNTLELKAADRALLIAALKELGFTIADTITADYPILTAYRNELTVNISDGQIRVRAGYERVVPEIRSAYSRQVVKSAAVKFGHALTQKASNRFVLQRRF